MDYTVLSNQELQKEVLKICKVYADRQDYKHAKASGAKERLYTILEAREPYGTTTTHKERVSKLQNITAIEFMQWRNSGVAATARAVYELGELGLKFKDEAK